MNLPDEARVLEALEVTWPAAEIIDSGPIRLRHGAGGGKRVSAASAIGTVSETDIDRAEAAMRALGQIPLFMLLSQDRDLDEVLDRRGYAIVDPVTLYVRTTAPGTVPPEAPDWTAPLTALWDGGGIGPDRRAVMDRVTRPKAVLTLPQHADPKAAVFVALDGEGAMLHALHVDTSARRSGLGRALTAGAVAWAAQAGADWIALAVTEANAPANALYTSLGFQPVGRYWYRVSGE